MFLRHTKCLNNLRKIKNNIYVIFCILDKKIKYENYLWMSDRQFGLLQMSV